MRLIKTSIWICIFACCILYGTACGLSDETSVIEKKGFAFNTTVQISLYDYEDEEVLQECFSMCNTYENIFSRTKAGSELYEINEMAKQAKEEWVEIEVSYHMQKIINKGLEYSKASEGAFDITIEPVSRLWDFSGENPKIPQKEQIEKAKELVDYRNCSLTGNILRIKKGMGIDLGGIAKGYIADRMKEYLEFNGVKHGLINLGGNILLIGGKTDKEKFSIGIQLPFGKQNETITAVSASDMSIVSSGIYERYFEQGDTLYHHILNPKTGYPYENQIAGITILAKSSTDADALSTLCYSLGEEKGLEYINKQEDIEAMYITKDNEKIYSKNFKEYEK